MQDRFKFRIAVFERYNTDEWEFTKFIENTDKFGVSTNGNVIQENVQSYIIHLTREKTPKNVYRTMEVMQCTGLKDKNSKLIYEGDILKGKKNMICSPHSSRMIDKVGVVEIPQNMFIATCRDVKNNCTLFCQNDWVKAEVIGNIYENSELLGVEND